MQDKKTTYGGFTADELLSNLTDAQTPQLILNNIHEMLVEWMRNNREGLDEHHESVYLTYVILKSFLKSMEEQDDE